jgi:hypothetical protein
VRPKNSAFANIRGETIASLTVDPAPPYASRHLMVSDVIVFYGHPISTKVSEASIQAGMFEDWSWLRILDLSHRVKPSSSR